MVCLCLGLMSASGFGQRVKGFDVSQFQGSINWSTAYQQGVRFAFVRCNRAGPMAPGLQLTDTGFLANMLGSSNVTVGGQPVTIYTGNYHAGRPDSFVIPPGTTTLAQYNAAITAHAQSEADFFYSDVSPYLTPAHLRPALDVETGGSTFLTGKAGYSLWVNSFLDRFEALSGIEPLVYCNTNYATSFMDSSLSGRDLWVANWGQPANNQSGNPATGIFPKWDFWQYDSPNGLGAQYGVSSGDIDLDVVHGDVTFLQSFLIPAPEPVSAALLAFPAVLLLRRVRTDTSARCIPRAH
jgi:GH25 family lysozyme M1 (1,4-beta-N-acetylmuramidase)